MCYCSNIGGEELRQQRMAGSPGEAQVVGGRPWKVAGGGGVMGAGAMEGRRRGGPGGGRRGAGRARPLAALRFVGTRNTGPSRGPLRIESSQQSFAARWRQGQAFVNARIMSELLRNRWLHEGFGPFPARLRNPPRRAAFPAVVRPQAWAGFIRAFRRALAPLR